MTVFRPILTASALALTVLAIRPALAADVTIAATGPVIELSVTQRLDSTPDTARIGTGVTTNAPTAQQALRDNAVKMDALVKKIKSLGIADRDIQTSGINISPVYNYRDQSEPQLTGYNASNQVQIDIQDMKNLGSIIDQLVAAGANNLNGPYFSLDNDSEVKNEARKQALTKGRAQALDYARLNGYGDVRVLQVSESLSGDGDYAPQQRGFAKASVMAEAAPTPVQPGQVGTSVTVNITYEMTR